MNSYPKKQMRILIPILLLAIGIVWLCFPRESAPRKEVVHLTYHHGALGIPDPGTDCIVDLENGKVWLVDGQKDSRAETLRKSLSAEDIERIRAVCKEVKLTEWKEKYPQMAMDGVLWRMEIVYDDGSVQTTSGINNWPKAFVPLSAIMEELMESDVFPYPESMVRS